MPKVTPKWCPSVEQLWNRYSFNPLTGKLHRRNTDRAIRGSIHRRGNFVAHRLTVTINGHSYNSSYGRVVNAWCAGKWCPGEVDHSDRNQTNNRPWNLIPGTVRANQLNKKSANGGCYWSKHHNRWCAQIELGTRGNRKNKNLGRFHTKEEAQAAYAAALARLDR